MLKDEKIDPRDVDIILHSREIKNLILNRIKENNINPLRLCNGAKIAFPDFQRYMNSGIGNVRTISHYDVKKIMRLLGLRLRIQVVVEEDDKINRLLRADVKYRESDLAEQTDIEASREFGKITGVEFSTPGNPKKDGYVSSGDYLGGNEKKLPKGNQVSDGGVTGDTGVDGRIQEMRKGNMATRYEI